MENRSHEISTKKKKKEEKEKKKKSEEEARRCPPISLISKMRRQIRGTVMGSCYSKTAFSFDMVITIAITIAIMRNVMRYLSIVLIYLDDLRYS